MRPKSFAIIDGSLFFATLLVFVAALFIQSLRAFRRAMIDGKVAKGTTTTWKFQTFQFTCFRGATFPNRATKTTKVVQIDVKNDLSP